MSTVNAEMSRPVSVQASKVKAFFKEVKKQRFLLLLMLPGIIWYICFRYLPLLGLSIAFTDYGFKQHVSFVGLKNFQRLFASTYFWNALKNTLIISGSYIIFYFPLPIILALLMNELFSVRIKRLIQFTVYVPYFFSWVVVGSVFATVLSPSSGVVNQVLRYFGQESVYFMAAPEWFRIILLLSYIWRTVGYGTVIYVATLTTIDPELYDAATVDGAGYWGRLLYVTLPGLRSTIATMLLLNLSNVLQVFDQVQVMYNAAVYSVSDVLMTYSFREGLLNGDIGFAVCISVFVSVISTTLVLTTNKLSKKMLDEGIL